MAMKGVEYTRGNVSDEPESHDHHHDHSSADAHCTEPAHDESADTHHTTTTRSFSRYSLLSLYYTSTTVVLQVWSSMTPTWL